MELTFSSFLEKRKKGNQVAIAYYGKNAVAHGQRTSRESFFQKFETFGLGQTNWAEILGGILGISSQTMGTMYFGTVSSLFKGKCSWIFFLQKRLVLGLKHVTPKSSQNKIRP